MTPTEFNLLQQRETTHGPFKDSAEFSQALKFLFRNQTSWLRMDVRQKEALDQISIKLGRIFSGRASFKDHWDDVAGYAKLGAEACDK